MGFRALTVHIDVSDANAARMEFPLSPRQWVWQKREAGSMLFSFLRGFLGRGMRVFVKEE